MIETLNQYDHELMLLLNYDGGAFLDYFWYAVSYKFSWVPLYAAILWCFVCLSRPTSVAGDANASKINLRTFLALIITTVLIILAADQLSSGLIKPLVERPRPSHQPGLMEQLHYVNDYHGGPYGFVSSHAANTLALAVWVSLLFRHRALYCAMAAFYIANCYSRIYLGVHYLGDILCGSLIGALCGWLGYTLYRKYQHGSLPVSSSHVSAPVTITCWVSLLAMLLLATCFC